MKRLLWIHIGFIVGAFFLVGRAVNATTTEPPAPTGEAVRVILLPDPLVLALGQSQNLVLIAEDADGRTREVTAQAQFSASGGQLDGSVITATTPGSFVLQGRYRDLTDNALLTAYEERPSSPPSAPAPETQPPAANASGIVAGVTTDVPANTNQPQAQTQEQTNVNPSAVSSDVVGTGSPTRAIALPWWADLLAVAFIVVIVLVWKRHRTRASKP